MNHGIKIMDTHWYMYLWHAFTLTKLERSVSKMSQSITRKKTNVMFIKVSLGKTLNEMLSLIKEKITLRYEKGRKSRDSGA